MIEKGKISAYQMAIMMHPTITATGILSIPAITAKYAERDMWLSPIWGSFMGFLVVYIAYQLNKLYPNETIIEYSEQILGQVLGKVLGFVYLFFFLHVDGMIVRQYAEFIVGSFMLRTPMILVTGTIVLASALAVRAGVEVVGRLSEILVPITILLLMLIIMLSVPDMEVKNMFPIMEKGITPSIMGSATPHGWFSEFFLISFLLPFLTDREKGMKWGMISVLVVMITLVVTNMATLFLFGGITASLAYPVMSLARYISIADFLEHLESVLMAIWVGGAFIKIAVFYYALVLGTAQWLNLSDYRPVVFPIGYLMVLFAIWSAPNLQELVSFIGTSNVFYLLSIQTVIPLFLLFIAYIRKGNQLKKKEE